MKRRSAKSALPLLVLPLLASGAYLIWPHASDAQQGCADCGVANADRPKGLENFLWTSTFKEREGVTFDGSIEGTFKDPGNDNRLTLGHYRFRDDQGQGQAVVPLLTDKDAIYEFATTFASKKADISAVTVGKNSVSGQSLSLEVGTPTQEVLLYGSALGDQLSDGGVTWSVARQPLKVVPHEFAKQSNIKEGFTFRGARAGTFMNLAKEREQSATLDVNSNSEIYGDLASDYKGDYYIESKKPFRFFALAIRDTSSSSDASMLKSILLQCQISTPQTKIRIRGLIEGRKTVTTQVGWVAMENIPQGAASGRNQFATTTGISAQPKFKVETRSLAQMVPRDGASEPATPGTPAPTPTPAPAPPTTPAPAPTPSPTDEIIKDAEKSFVDFVGDKIKDWLGGTAPNCAMGPTVDLGEADIKDDYGKSTDLSNICLDPYNWQAGYSVGHHIKCSSANSKSVNACGTITSLNALKSKLQTSMSNVNLPEPPLKIENRKSVHIESKQPYGSGKGEFSLGYVIKGSNPPRYAKTITEPLTFDWRGNPIVNPTNGAVCDLRISTPAKPIDKQEPVEATQGEGTMAAPLLSQSTPVPSS